jgi:hypothetical protein
MDNKSIQAAISSIENQLEILKAACGLSPDVGEEHHEDEEHGKAPRRPARRGRHVAMAKYAEEDESE